MSLSTLDPELAAFIAQMPPLPKGGTIEEQRATFDAWTISVQKSQEGQLPDKSEYTLQDNTVPVEGGEIKVRSVIPKGAEGETFPLLVWYHGGGWAIGDIRTDDYFLRILSVKLKIVTVNVDYRLAPEHVFPAGFNDSYAALKWAVQNASQLSVSPSKGLIVGGASAGGNLSAAISLAARDDAFFKGNPITGQLLIIPLVIHTQAHSGKYASELNSFEENKDTPVLSSEDVRFFCDQVGVNPPEDPRFSPLLASDHGNLPPAYFQIAGADPLRDEGILYEKVLRGAGAKTKIDVYPGLPHGGNQLAPQIKISKKFDNDTLEGIKWLLSH